MRTAVYGVGTKVDISIICHYLSIIMFNLPSPCQAMAWSSEDRLFEVCLPHAPGSCDSSVTCYVLRTHYVLRSGQHNHYFTNKRW